MKSNQAQAWSQKKSFNCTIRSKRIRNEWSVEVMKNRFRLSLGHWPLEGLIFFMLYPLAVKLVKYSIGDQVLSLCHWCA